MSDLDILRAQAVRMRKDGKTNREIKEELGVSRSWIKKWMARDKEGEGFRDRPHTGRPHSQEVEPSEVNSILKSKESLRRTKRKLEEEGKKVSHETIRKIAGSSGLRYRLRRRKPKLTPAQKEARVKFASQHRSRRFWSNVIFTDEKYFRVGEGQRGFWMEDDEEPEPLPTQSHPPSFMVWGGFCRRGVIPLYSVAQGLKLDAPSYQQILDTQLIRPANRWFVQKSNWKLLQDNAPPHSAFSTKHWLSEHHINAIFPWPANSPDLNPIENLWHIVAERAAKHEPQNLEELRQAVKQEWEQIEPSVLENLVDSMPRRMKLVIDTEGDATKY